VEEPKPLIDSSLLLGKAWQRALYHPFQGWVEAALGFSRINLLYRRVGRRGLNAPAFCRAGLEDLGVTWGIDGLEHLRAVSGPCLVVANHPLGGREAMALHCVLAASRDDYRILSNPLLNYVEEVSPQLILVDPFETKAAARANTGPLRETLRFLRQGGLIGVFPAGEVSYWQAAEKRIADKAWAEQTVRLALRAQATVVPLHFGGSNGAVFNGLARIHPSLKVPLLAQQLAFGPCRHVQATLGPAVAFDALPYKDDPSRLARWLREQTYALAPQAVP
jgi:putative hemolysin